MTGTQRLLLASVGLVLSLGGCACGDECEIGKHRCLDEVTMERCELAGPDQLTPVKPSTFTCLEPNLLCAELPGDEAACVLPEEDPCTASFVPHCQGSLLLFCATGADGGDGLVAARDCADEEGTGRCGEREGAPGEAGCL